jgi:hypothetical protein
MPAAAGRAARYGYRVSWDIVLLHFRDGAAVAFDGDKARRIVLAQQSVQETEPGVAEVTADGVADIHFGGESPEIMFFVFAGSQTVTQLVYELARALQMVVFFPEDSNDAWGAAVVEATAAEAMPDPSWSGWEDFGEDFRPPQAALCPTVADLDAVLGGAYAVWEHWAHPQRE